MNSLSLLFLRVSMGWLQIIWGLDKLVNVEHGVRVATAFYGGIGADPTVQTAFGICQILLGLLVVVGLFRRVAYPVQTLVVAITAAGVWKSILDPWGWALEGTNALFYPSLIILAAALVLQTSIHNAAYSLDSRRQRPD